MRLNNQLAKCGSILAAVMLLAGAASAADIVTSYVGCSTATGDDPTISPGTLDGTAGNARSDFLNQIGNKYYYEDFQEVTFGNPNKLDISSSGYTLDFKPYNLAAGGAGFNPGYAAPTTKTLTSNDATKNGDFADVSFQQGALGATTRGAFDTFESGLDDAYSGEGLDDTTNQYVDIANEGKNGTLYGVTIAVSPGYNAMGLMLNDVIQPSKTNVSVTFSDGTTETMGALNSNGKAGALTTNNTWFLGIVDQSNATITSVTINEAADGDPITLDNIYLGDITSSNSAIIVPLPASALGGGALLGLLAVARRRGQRL